MSRIAQNVWTRLAGDRVQGQALWARRAAPDDTDLLLAALDADERRHLLVPIEEIDPEYEDSLSRGITVITRDLAVPGHQAGAYLDITCLDGSGHDAFDMIGGELVDRLISGVESRTECVQRVLSKWRRFWGHTPKNLMSRDAQVGLFAELWFLAYWLIPRRGTISVGEWRGPFGGRHDFERKDRSIEVKGTTSATGLVHHVNGLNQLDDPEQGDLLMFSMRLREEAGATNTLPGVVAFCRSLLVHDSVAMDVFELGINTTGYTAAHESDYERTHWRVVDQQLFAVKEDFPRLSVSILREGLPAGVGRIGYDIDLSSFQHLCVARRQSDEFVL